MSEGKKNGQITETIDEISIIKKSRIRSKGSDVELKKEVVKVLPPDTPESELEREIPESREIAYVGDLKEW